MSKKKPAKIWVDPFKGTAYDKETEECDVYLAKSAIIKGVMDLLPKIAQMGSRADATPVSKALARKYQSLVIQIANQIAKI